MAEIVSETSREAWPRSGTGKMAEITLEEIRKVARSNHQDMPEQDLFAERMAEQSDQSVDNHVRWSLKEFRS